MKLWGWWRRKRKASSDVDMYLRLRALQEKMFRMAAANPHAPRLPATLADCDLPPSTLGCAIIEANQLIQGQRLLEQALGEDKQKGQP